jgi:plastocyanin
MFNHKFNFSLFVFLTIFMVACGGGGETTEAPAAESTPEVASGVTPDLSEAGSISGKVNFEGTKPRMPRIRMSAEPTCEAKHSGPTYAQTVLINENGTLKNVFIWVKEGLEDYKFDTPTEAATLDQDGCLYSPHVFGVQTNQKINIGNSDSVTHNIHPVPKNNREWNISQSPEQKYERSFPRQEIMVPVKCNVHPWMKAYIGVISHPYFSVTGADGSFNLNDLPPGDYTVEAWHEKFGTQEQKLTVAPNGASEINFVFQG